MSDILGNLIPLPQFLDMLEDKEVAKRVHVFVSHQEDSEGGYYQKMEGKDEREEVFIYWGVPRWVNRRANSLLSGLVTLTYTGLK